MSRTKTLPDCRLAAISFPSGLNCVLMTAFFPSLGLRWGKKGVGVENDVVKAVGRRTAGKRSGDQG